MVFKKSIMCKNLKNEIYEFCEINEKKGKYAIYIKYLAQ